MKKVAAITWAPSGKKLAVGAADRVTDILCSQSISSMRTDRRKTSSPPNHPTRDKSLILLEDFSSLLILKKLQLHKVITLFLFIRLV